MTETLVPYSFVPGTKAKAGEINANFQFLNNKISTVSTNVDSNLSELQNYVNMQVQNGVQTPFCVVNGLKATLGDSSISLSNGQIATGENQTLSLTDISDVTISLNKFEAVVPTMTAATTGSFVASADSSTAGYEPYKAFDGVNYTGWRASTLGTNTLKIQLDAACKVEYFSVTVLDSPYFLDDAPTKCALRGSNDGYTWTLLSEYEDIIFKNRAEKQYFKVRTDNEYSYYSLTTDARTIFEFNLYKLSQNGSFIPDDRLNLFIKPDKSTILKNNSIFIQDDEPIFKAQNDVWFQTVSPYKAKIYNNSQWDDFEGVPIGYLTSDSSGENLNFVHFGYRQNGLIISKYTPEDMLGEIATKNDVKKITKNIIRQTNLDYKITNLGTTIAYSGAVSGLPATITLSFLPNDGAIYEVGFSVKMSLSAEAGCSVALRTNLVGEVAICGTNNWFQTSGSGVIYTDNRQVLIYNIALQNPGSVYIDFYASYYRKVVL